MNYGDLEFGYAHDANLIPKKVAPGGWLCNSKGCENCTADILDMSECIACKKRFCADCVQEFGGEKYCAACTVCDHCQNDQVVGCCEDCGELLCATHSRMVIDEDNETGYHAESHVCAPRCRPAQLKEVA